MQPPSQVEVNLQNLFQFHSIVDNKPIEPITWQSWFQFWLSELSIDIPKANAYELSLRLTNDLEIQTLNAQYRHQDRPTDVLAFATLDLPQFSNPTFLTEPLYIGDIVISVETALRQAQDRQHSLNRELVWLASHGFLHLLGWDHPDDSSLLLMLAQQEKLLQSIDTDL